jgi:hypothetical protein
MDIDTKALTASLVLLLAAFPLTAVGTDRDLTWLWWLGLAVLAIGSAIPPALRLVGGGGNDTDDEGADDTDGRGGDGNDKPNDRPNDKPNDSNGGSR